MARILGPDHWRAAQERRAMRHRLEARAAYMPKPAPRRPTLDEIMGYAPPDGGNAA